MRICAHEGCFVPLDGAHGNARYCSGRCRSAAYKARTGYRVVGVRNAPQTRKKTGGESGLQLSWAKAVRVVATQMQNDGYEAEDAEWVARLVLRGALSARQRERLDGRT